MASALAVLAQSMVAAVVAVLAVVADVVAVALSSTVEAFRSLVSTFQTTFVDTYSHQFEIASLLPPPSPDSRQD